MEIRATDYHTAGEPFRIVTGGVEPLTRRDDPRQAARRARAARPRARACSSTSRAATRTCTAASSSSRTTPAADLGVVFFHNAGYSTACGHGTIALVTWALDDGLVARREGENHVVVDVPSGRLDTWATVEGGRVRVGALPQRPRPSSGRRAWSVGERTVDVAFGGAFYASLEERVEPAELPRLIELGRELKRELEARHDVVHPLEPELRDVYGVVFWQDGGRRPAHPAQRDGVRRRRGRPLALRQRHVRPARAARRARVGSRAARRCGT